MYIHVSNGYYDDNVGYFNIFFFSILAKSCCKEMCLVVIENNSKWTDR